MQLNEKNKDGFVLSSGRHIYANNGIIGLNSNAETYGGYDGLLEDIFNPFTREERAELAEHMIRKWQAYGEAGPTEKVVL